MKRRKRRGHWCWCCQRALPNERFTGRGHSRHLCKGCSSLPKEERTYRQAVLDVDRIMSQAGKLQRKGGQLERLLEHGDERVRQYALTILQPAECEDEPDEDCDWPARTRRPT